MVIKKFEDIIAWQKSQELAELVYNLFRDNKDFRFKNQICSAAVSISNNIAEGFDRSSAKDFIRFLYIALASSSEVKSMLYLAIRLNYISQIEFEKLKTINIEISKIINGLIKSIRISNRKY